MSPQTRDNSSQWREFVAQAVTKVGREEEGNLETGKWKEKGEVEEKRKCVGGRKKYEKQGKIGETFLPSAI